MEKKLIDKPKMPEEKNKAFKKDLDHTWSQQEKELFKSQYGCDVLKQNCTLEEAKDANTPSDAFIVSYEMNGKICYDLTRSSKMVSIFDMYYDKLGPVVRKIDWGYGTINPKNWGYVSPKNKKRK